MPALLHKRGGVFTRCFAPHCICKPMKSDSDLYSFLRSKDFVEDENVADEAASEADSAEDDADGASPSAPVSSSDAASAPAASSSSHAPASELDFDDPDLIQKLHRYSDDELDRANFGIVRVDDEGTVLFYNKHEAENAGVRPEDARGKNFFTGVAPCSNNRIFRGRFKKGMMKGTLDEAFTYTFTYKMSPTLVDIRMLRDEQANNWIVIRFRYTQS